MFDHYMAMNPGYVEEEITGIPTFEPSFHLPAIWITESAERTCGISWIYGGGSTVYHCNASDGSYTNSFGRSSYQTGCPESY